MCAWTMLSGALVGCDGKGGDSGDSGGDSGGDCGLDSQDSAPETLPAGLVVLEGVIPVFPPEGADPGGALPAQDALLLGDTLYGFRATGTAYPSDATILDEHGRWLVPGLIDGHVHLAHSGAGVWTGDPLAANLRANLYHGVTSVFDLGGPTVLFSLRDAIVAGDAAGPTIFATGPFLTAIGSHPCETWFDDDLCTFVDPSDAAPAALARIAEGADAIKIAVADAAFTDWPTPRLDLAALAAITGTGVPVIAHVDADADVIDAVAAGVGILAHPVFAGPMSDEALTAAATARGVESTVGAFGAVGALLDGTRDLSDPGLILGPGVLDNWIAVRANPDVLEPGWADASAEWAAAAAQNLPTLRAEGATVIAGSDAGYYFVPHGLALHEELAGLVTLGWSPLEALASATTLPHAALGFPGGTLADGAPADLLLLVADPTLDVGALDQIETVYVRGVRYPRASLRTVDILADGSASDGDLCLEDADCPADDTCDGLSHVCRLACPEPYAPVSDCGADAWCNGADGTATDSEGTCHDIPVGCDLYAQDCGPDYYHPACVPYDSDTNACWYGGTRAVGESCSYDDPDLACTPGLFCSTITARCYELCDPDGADTCTGRQRCTLQYADAGVPWFGLCL